MQVRNSYCTGIAEDDESQMQDMEQRIEAAEVGPHATPTTQMCAHVHMARLRPDGRALPACVV